MWRLELYVKFFIMFLSPCSHLEHGSGKWGEYAFCYTRLHCYSTGSLRTSCTCVLFVPSILVKWQTALSSLLDLVYLKKWIKEKLVNFQTCMHLTHAFVCVPAGPKEEFHREYYSNYYLPEDCAGEKQDACFAGTHELPQGKEEHPCGLSSCLCPGFTA